MNKKQPLLQLCNINLLLFAVIIFPFRVQAQNTTSGLSRQPEGLIHIATVGTIVDTVNVWGKVGRTGRYVIPQGLNIAQLISYAGGIGSSGSNRQQLEWIKNRILVNVDRYVPGEGKVHVKSFKSNYNKPLPVGLFTYKLKNEDIVTVEVKRKPNFWDYLRRVSPILGIITSVVILSTRW
jgi:protein involved in polysaccharide export with SLBB domain